MPVGMIVGLRLVAKENCLAVGKVTFTNAMRLTVFPECQSAAYAIRSPYCGESSDTLQEGAAFAIQRILPLLVSSVRLWSDLFHILPNRSSGIGIGDK